MEVTGSQGVLVGVGLACGWLSAVTGLGAGLSLPLLALLGMPLPGALLAAKLPVAAGDVVQALGLSRTDPAPLRHAPLLAGLCGAVAAMLAMVLPAAGLAAVVALGAAWACLRALPPAGAARAPWHETAAWSVYIGGLGCLSVWMQGWRALRCGRSWSAGRREAIYLGAAANLGAVCVLLLGHPLDDALWWLAAGQGVGAWLGGRSAWVWRRAGAAPSTRAG